MSAFESTDQVDQVMQGDQLQALWEERRRLKAKFQQVTELLSVPGGPGPVEIRKVRILAQEENVQ